MGVASLCIIHGVSALQALDIQPLLVPAFETISKYYYSFGPVYIGRPFSLINDFLIDGFMSFCPHLVSNLPVRCHSPFLLHLSLPSLFCLVFPHFFSRVLLFYSLCDYRYFKSSNILFSTLLALDGPPPRTFFRCLKSSFASVPALTAANHSLWSRYSLSECHGNGFSRSWSSIIFLQAILVTLAWFFRFAISCTNLDMSPWYFRRLI